MQYLIQIADEFRESYKQIDSRVDDIVDRLDLVARRLEEVEQRINPNRQEPSD